MMVAIDGYLKWALNGLMVDNRGLMTMVDDGYLKWLWVKL